MKSDDFLRWMGIDPTGAHLHELDIVTEEAKRERAEYLEMLSRATFTIKAVPGENVLVTLDVSPVTASRDDAQ